MRKAFKYKFLQLVANTVVLWMFLGMLALYNFQALVNSGGLASGVDGFNNSVKYQLLTNNYLFVLAFFGLIYAVLLGSRIVGRDMQTGHLGVLLSSYPSRTGYYLASVSAVAVFMFLTMAIITINLIILLGIFHVDYPRAEIFQAFFAFYLNALILMVVTGFFSVVKPSTSAFFGLAGYAYYSLYTYNELPFVQMPLTVDMTQYKDLLCLFFPVRDVMIPSYTPTDVIQLYSIETLGIPTGFYQILFALLVTALGAAVFVHKDI